VGQRYATHSPASLRNLGINTQLHFDLPIKRATESGALSKSNSHDQNSLFALAGLSISQALNIASSNLATLFGFEFVLVTVEGELNQAIQNLRKTACRKLPTSLDTGDLSQSRKGIQFV
jgi:hypothetical protein